MSRKATPSAVRATTSAGISPATMRQTTHVISGPPGGSGTPRRPSGQTRLASPRRILPGMASKGSPLERPSAKGVEQRARSGSGVAGREDRPDHGDARCPRGAQLGNIGGRDTADGDYGN